MTGNKRTRQIFEAMIRHEHIVFDSNTAPGHKGIDTLPIERRSLRAHSQRGQQHGNEIETRFNRNHLPGLEIACGSQVRVIRWWLANRSSFIYLLPANVVHLQTEVMTQSVREEGTNQAGFARLVQGCRDQPRFDQQ